MKIAIIGAGWAGLAAALKLQHQDIKIFEAAKVAGGRARPLQHPNLNLTIDNGQHILIGAYSSTFNLMRALGIEPNQVCYRQALKIESLDKSLRLQYLAWPRPFNLLGVLTHSHGLGGFKGRLHLIKVIKVLKQDINVELNAYAWLESLDCPPELFDRFWQPLCLAITNTDLNRTQAKIFARTLVDSIASNAKASDIYIPRNTLADLWQNRACELLGDKIEYQPIKFIEQVDSAWRIAGEHFDKVIIATPAPIAAKLLSNLDGASNYLKSWPKFEYAAIGTLVLQLSKPWLNSMPMAMLFDNPANNAWGQWAFNHYYLSGKNLVNVVIGNAGRYLDVPQTDIVAGVCRQLQKQSTVPVPSLVNSALITEKRATFYASCAVTNRPGAITPWPGLFLAGDWTDTGYPAVLEGAVRSGLLAAEHVLSN